MNTLETFLERSREIVAKQGATEPVNPSLPDALTEGKAIIIGCADMRVDPALVLGLKPGEAVVMRNIGGRVTPGLIAQLGMLGRIGQVADRNPGGGGEFNIILIQHTDCGITRLAKDTNMLAQYFEVQEEAVSTEEVLDPRKAVAKDVAAIKSISALPNSWLISGLVYDVTTGRIETVVPAGPIRK